MDENQVTAYLERSDNGDLPFTPPPTVIELKGTLVTFGRGIGNVVIWESLQISRRHAVMEYRNQSWKIKDTSTNGMMVNGRRIPHDEFIDLEHMDVIAFVPTGSLQYRFFKVTRSPPKINNSPRLLQSSIGVPPTVPLRASSSFGEAIQLLTPSPVGTSTKSQSPKRKTNNILCEPSSISAHSDRKRKRLLLNVPVKSEPENEDEEEELLDIDEMPLFYDPGLSSSLAIRSPSSNSVVKKENDIDLGSLHEDESPRVREMIKAYKDRIAELENTNRRVQSEKEKELTDLRKKLGTAQSETRVFQEELFKKLAEVMEAEFSCCICNEIFIQATVIDCGHTFCAHCISEWVKRKTECPNCRKAVKIQVKHVEMENFITKVHGLLSEEMHLRREEIIQDRMKEVENVKAAAAAAAAAARVPHARGRGRGAANEYPFTTGEQFADFLQDLQLHHDMFVPHHTLNPGRRATHGNLQVPGNVLGGLGFAPQFQTFADFAARGNPPAPGPPGGPGSRRRSSRINPHGGEANVNVPSRTLRVRGRGGHGPEGVHPPDGLHIHLSRVADFGPMDILTVD